MKNNKKAIIVKDVEKVFKIPLDNSFGIKQKIVNFANNKKGYRLFKPLKKISLTINHGDFYGIVGRNGSGKSTLLKTIAGIYNPDSGSVEVNGSLVPFIELGVGFNGELSGRENVYLNCALLGFNRIETKSMYEDIVEFAELHDFMEEKIKNYSSGMQVRLAFSIAIQAKGDILLLDEVLAVGDTSFQEKCFKYFEELKRNKKTIILVTHDMSAIKRFCNKATMIEDGEIKLSGSPEEVANQYTLDNLNHEIEESNKKDKNLSEYVKKLDIKAISNINLSSNDKFIFQVDYEMNIDMPIDLGISILYQGQSIVEHNTKQIKLGCEKNKTYSIKYSLPLNYFNQKRLDVTVAIFRKSDFSLIGYNLDSLSFEIKENNTLPSGGLLKLKGDWIYDEKQ